MAEEWPSCFWHPVLMLFCVVYVDDFKLSGPKANLPKGWVLVRQGLQIDDPHPLDIWLGCNHKFWERLHEGRTIRGISYDMESFLRSSVEAYITKSQDCGYRPKLRKVETPFIEDPPKYEDLEEEAKLAVLAPCAASVLMKVLYCARIARPDLCRAVCFLARECTRWTRWCDRALHRIMCYIHSTYELRLEGWVGDEAAALSLHAYADADFAGCPKTKRSTSGGVALHRGTQHAVSGCMVHEETDGDEPQYS